MKTNKKQEVLRTLRPIAYCLLLTILLSLAGCKTATKVGTVEAGAAKEQAAFFESIQKQAYQYTTFSARTNMDIEMPGGDFTSRVDIKIICDSALQLSVQPFLGIEVFRLEFNLDSVKVFDRMNKRYVAESYALLKGRTPIDFNYYNLQSLFMNRIFIPGEKTISAKQYNRFKLVQEGLVAEAKVKDAQGLAYTFQADGEEKLLSTHVTDKSEKHELQWLYTDFQLEGGQPFPMLVNVSFSNEKFKQGGLKISFNRIQSDIPLVISNPIPDKYQKVTFEELIKALKNIKK